MSPAGGPGNPLLEQSIPELQYTDGAVLASSEAAEMRRQRKFREGFAAYTAPPTPEQAICVAPCCGETKPA